MTVTVNGQERTVAAGTAVADLVADVTGDRERRGVAVALNGEVVRRGAWEDRTVEDGDRVEILNAVQGG